VTAPQWADVPLDGIPEPLARLAHALLLTPVVDLLHLGLTGTTPGGATVGLAASFRPGAVAVLVLAAWVVARVGATRRRFRWEPRR
jgi:ABC-2 type transport system permease protein